MNLSRSRVVVPALAAALVAGCAASGASVEVTSEAAGSPYFSLSRPAVYRAGGGLEMVGRVCRRARTTLLTPSRVRLEHVSRVGDVVAATHAYLAPIYRYADQACSNYSARVDWTIGDGEAVRACFDRGHPCAAGSPARALVPASP